MPYLKPKLDAFEEEVLFKLVEKYTEVDADHAGEVFSKILKFVEGVMKDVYHFYKED